MIATIIILAALVIIVALCIYSIIKRRKNHTCSCSSCSGCSKPCRDNEKEEK